MRDNCNNVDPERRRALISERRQFAFDRYVLLSKAALFNQLPEGLHESEIEPFLRNIESDPQWGVVFPRAKQFRLDVQEAFSQYLDKNGSGPVPYTIHESLRHCIEHHVVNTCIKLSGFTGRIYSQK